MRQAAADGSVLEARLANIAVLLMQAHELAVRRLPAGQAGQLDRLGELGLQVEAVAAAVHSARALIDR